MKPLIFYIFSLSTLSLQAEALTAKIGVTFDGTSTLHDFTGHGESEAPAEWQLNDQGALLSIPEIVFKVTTLSTDHKKRDKKMLKMFEPEDHPTISGNVKAWALPAKEASAQILILTLHGKTIEVPVQAEAYQITHDGISLNCSFTLSLAESDLKRPSALGVIRVGDEVKLKVNLLLSQP